MDFCIKVLIKLSFLPKMLIRKCLPEFPFRFQAVQKAQLEFHDGVLIRVQGLVRELRQTWVEQLCWGPLCFSFMKLKLFNEIFMTLIAQFDVSMVKHWVIRLCLNSIKSPQIKEFEEPVL